MFKFKKKTDEELEQKDTNLNDVIMDESDNDYDENINISSNNTNDEEEFKNRITRDDLFSATKRNNFEDSENTNNTDEESFNDEPKEDSIVAGTIDNDDIVTEEDTRVEIKEDTKVEIKEETLDENPKSKKEIRKMKKKEMHESNINTEFKVSSFILKLIVSVLLFTFTFVIYLYCFQDRVDDAIYITLFCAGGATVLASIISMFSVVGSFYSPGSRRVILIFSLVQLLLGIYVIVSAFIYMKYQDSDFSKIVTKPYFQYFISASLYLYSVLYLWKTCVHKAKASHLMFWVNIYLITVACFINATANTVPDKENLIIYASISLFLGVVLLVISLVEYHVNQKRLKKQIENEESTNSKDDNSNDNEQDKSQNNTEEE